MIKRHLDSSILSLLASCELDSKATQWALRHALSCDRCRNLLTEMPSSAQQVIELFLDRRERQARRAASTDIYTQAIDKAFTSVLEVSAKLEAQRRESEYLIHELLGLSTEQQRLVIENSSRYHNWAIAEKLLEVCRAGWAEKPAASEDLATLAFAVTEKLRASGFRERALNDLKAEAWSYIANCRRIQSDFRASEEAFRRADIYLQLGTRDDLERAQLLNLESSLLRALRDFEGAGRLLDGAICAYRAAGDGHLEGRALIQRAKLLYESGDVEKSIPILRRASELVDVLRDPSLVFHLRQNLVFNLNEAGRAREAWDLLPEVRQLAREHGSRLDRLRLLWTEGLICRNLGKIELAEEALRQVREGFIAEGIGYDVALVSLDLAALYLEAHRTAEVKQLGAEMLPIFASRNIQREAIMAWTVFRQAVEREVATVRVIEEVAARIREIQGRPGPAGEPR